jgi:hypothetical protein
MQYRPLDDSVVGKVWESREPQTAMEWLTIRVTGTEETS